MVLLITSTPCTPSLLLCSMYTGAYVNGRDHRKRTPLHVAAEEGKKEVVTFLLDKKAGTNITDVDRNTPLDLAAEQRHWDVIHILVERSAPSTKDSAVSRSLVKIMKPKPDTKDDLIAETDTKDDLIAEKIKEMSRFGYEY